MRKIYTNYFRDDIFHLYVLISFDYFKQNKKVRLDQIVFFKNEEKVLDYIRTKNLKLISLSDIGFKSIINDLKKLIIKYLSRRDLNLFEEIQKLDIELDLKNKFKTEFSQKVIDTVLKIKPGQISTYSEIGYIIGSKGYRAIGNVLRNNPLPLIIPCHRVIRKNGKIGGFSGMTENSWETNLKKNLLKLEGFKV